MENNELKERNIKLIEYQENVIALYEKGITMEHIAKRLKKNFRIISFIINISGIEINKSLAIRKRKEIDIEELMILHDKEGLSQLQLAKMFNVSEGTINNRLREGRLLKEVY
jgi:predicted DNA-binding protein (UPF0251 family)